MAKFRMSDGTLVDTARAQQVWDEARRWDGRNFISVPTGSQWEHQTLYRSRRGRYYVEHRSDWQGSQPSAEWVSNEEAARWLLLCGHELPDDIRQLADQVIE